MPIALRPGEPAPVSGLYEKIGGLGERTNDQVMASKGDRLPWAPPGHLWRLVTA